MSIRWDSLRSHNGCLSLFDLTGTWGGGAVDDAFVVQSRLNPHPWVVRLG